MSRLLLLFVICIISGNAISESIDGTRNSSTPDVNSKVENPVVTAAESNSKVPSLNATVSSDKIEALSSGIAPAKAQENTETSTLVTQSSSDATSETTFTNDATIPNSNVTVSNISTSSPTPNTSTSTTTMSTSTNTSITSPSPMPSTTLPLTILPPAQLGNWTFGDKNQTCVMIQMAAQFNVSYMTTMNETSFLAFNLPPSNETKVVNGSCGKTEDYIVLSWNATHDTTNNFTLHFVKNTKQNEYSLHHFEIALAAAYLPMYNSNNSLPLLHNASHFSVGLSNSYKCKQPPNLVLINSTNAVVGNLTVTQLQFQAFRTDNSTQFGAAKDCIFDTPDIVPIAVGCALAGLVVIVLIAYLVGRRRSQVRGYNSM